MKKILILGILLILFFIGAFQTFADCSWNGDFAGSLESCFSSTDLVKSDSDLKVDGGMQEKILDWKNRLAFYFGIAAVFGLVFAGLTLAISAGNEEKINKAKDIAKWSIIGFLAILFASTIITILVKFFYSL